MESEKGIKFEKLRDIVDNGVHEIYVNTKVDDGIEIAEYMGLLNSAEVPDNPEFPKICEAISYFHLRCLT